MKKIKNILSVATVIVAASVLVLLSSCQKKESEFVFKIGTSNSGLCSAPLHIAVDNGIFAEEFGKAGLKFETVEINMQEATTLVVAQKIDACMGLAGSLVPQMDNGLEISFLSGVHTGCTKFYVRGDSPYQTLADLRGQTIGFPGAQDSSVIAFQRKFQDYGFVPYGPNAEFKVAVYGMTDLPIALANGAVEGVGLHDPVAYIAEKDYGFRKVLDTTEDERFSQEYCCMTYVSSEIAKKYPEHTKAFVRAILKASAFVQKNPRQAAQIQIDNNQMTGDVEQNGYLLATYNYTPSVVLARRTVHDAIDQLVDMGVMQNVSDKEKFVADHFVCFDDVPDSYICNDDGTFSEAGVPSLKIAKN